MVSSGKSITTVVEQWLLSLSVPEVILDELSEMYGRDVWRCVVRNRLLGVPARHGVAMLVAGGEAVDYWALALGAEAKVSGTLGGIMAEESVPEWLIYYSMLAVKVSTRDQLAVVSRKHSKELAWWLAERAVLGVAAKREATKRAVADKKRWYRVSRMMDLWDSDRRSASGAWRRHGWQEASHFSAECINWPSEEESREVGVLLGDGGNTESLTRWRKMFDLAACGVDLNVVTMAQSVVLVEGDGHTMALAGAA